MRKSLLLFTVLAFAVSLLSSCEAIGGIFKAGMWVGVIVVVLIVALVLWLIGKVRK
ncbi:hypothetical protein [Segetibacter aerophilus]|jgi:hypothetical protein|uniref:hypothetical protein n=1 Tax=Segetibacter aerophilus TaxID=670293 RepID=UPI001479832C|nr:hypothetical protein [Segetibacter aerophilus]